MRLRLLSPSSERGSRVTHDDVLFGYRLQLFALVAERGVSEACGLMGVHRLTYYRWKGQVQRSGLEMLRPRERRRPQMPKSALGDGRAADRRVRARASRLGPRRVAARLARPEWGGLVVSPNGVYKVQPPDEGSSRCRPAPPAVRSRSAARAWVRAAAQTHQRSGLADHRDRHLQLLRLGRSRRLSARRPNR